MLEREPPRRWSLYGLSGKTTSVYHASSTFSKSHQRVSSVKDIVQFIAIQNQTSHRLPRVPQKQVCLGAISRFGNVEGDGDKL